jgi:hypothetical protein
MAFKDLLSIPSIVDTTKVWAYPDLLDFNGQGADDTGQRSSFRVCVMLCFLPAKN